MDATPTSPRGTTSGGRNIVLCFDGTNNRFDATNTNVVKMYSMVDRTHPDQLAYYQPGIGTMPPPGMWGKLKRWFVTRLDLAVAWLLPEHVCDGYRFLMRYYQEGDRIFIFGFSRGAYSARVLAAMLYKVGLLTQGNEELIPFAWTMFKKEQDPELYKGFRHTFGRRVRVQFLGLWDTVSSVGWFWNPKSLQFTANNPIVDVVRHAVSLDERRAYFRQNLWGNRYETTDVLQVWFPGVHCDVGGGYPEAESGLSKLALRWMVEQVKPYHLRFHPKAVAELLPETDTPGEAAPSPVAMQHESLAGLWWLVEYLPKPVQKKVGPDRYETEWIIPGGRPRKVPGDAQIDPSVYERIQAVPAYDPPNLP